MCACALCTFNSPLFDGRPRKYLFVEIRKIALGILFSIIHRFTCLFTHTSDGAALICIKRLLFWSLAFATIILFFLLFICFGQTSIPNALWIHLLCWLIFIQNWNCKKVESHKTFCFAISRICFHFNLFLEIKTRNNKVFSSHFCCERRRKGDNFSIINKFCAKSTAERSFCLFTRLNELILRNYVENWISSYISYANIWISRLHAFFAFQFESFRWIS